jgi:hypothetical protein
MPENPQLTIALITSVTSLVVAIVGMVVTLLNNRNSIRANKEVEKLKHELAQAAVKNSINDAHFNESIKALQQAIQSIQLIKDQVQIALNASSRIYNFEIVVQGISDARAKVFSSYEEQLVNVEDEAGQLFHKAKNTSFQVEQLVKEAVVRKNKPFQLKEEEKERLEKHRNELSEIQQVLRDKRAEKIMKRLGVNNP